MVRNGYEAVLAVLAFSVLAIALVFLVSLPASESDGLIDSRESVLDPS